MPDRDLIYTDINQVKSNTERCRLVLKKTIRCKYGYSIAKGTEVDVKIETIIGERCFSVAYPGSSSLMLKAKTTDFVSLEENITPIETNVKVGDVYWFVTIDNSCVWKDTVVKTNNGGAYFEKCQYEFYSSSIKKDGKFIINLQKFKPDTTVIIKIIGKYLSAGRLVNVRINNEVWFSKNKSMVQDYALQLIKIKKEQKLAELQGIADEYAEQLSRFESLENKEKEISKL